MESFHFQKVNNCKQEVGGRKTETQDGTHAMENPYEKQVF